VKRRKTLEQAVFDAVEREQKRFAGDLHDGLCQELAGIAMMRDATVTCPTKHIMAELRQSRFEGVTG
jgi:signal transduction histidine kinase